MAEKAYSDFYRTIKTDGTRESYDLSLKQFREWMKAKTYTALLKREPKEIQSKIISYMDSLMHQYGRNTRAFNIDHNSY